MTITLNVTEEQLGIMVDAVGHWMDCCSDNIKDTECNVVDVESNQKTIVDCMDIMTQITDQL